MSRLVASHTASPRPPGRAVPLRAFSFRVFFLPPMLGANYCSHLWHQARICSIFARTWTCYMYLGATSPVKWRLGPANRASCGASRGCAFARSRLRLSPSCDAGLRTGHLGVLFSLSETLTANLTFPCGPRCCLDFAQARKPRVSPPCAPGCGVANERPPVAPLLLRRFLAVTIPNELVALLVV